MLAKSRKFKLGLFVMAAVAVLLGVLLGLAGNEWRRSTFAAYTLFNESVQGLETGAAVKFRGVTVGRVTRVTFRLEDSLVRVDLQLAEGNLAYDNRTELDQFFEDKIRSGMRCQLQLAGITGMKFIEIDYPSVSAKAEESAGLHFAQPPPGREGREAFYIPSSPSFLTGLADDIRSVSRSMTTVMDGLQKVDFNKIGTDVQTLVNTANKYVSDERLDRILSALTEASEQIRAVTSALKDQRLEEVVTPLKQALDGLYRATVDIRQKANDLDVTALSGDISAAAGSVKQAAELFSRELEQAAVPQAAEAAHQTLNQASQTMTDLRRSLASLDRTLDALRNTLEMLEEDPGSLLRGKRTPKAAPGPDGGNAR